MNREAPGLLDALTRLGGSVFAMLQKYQEVSRSVAGDTVAMTIVRRERLPGRIARRV